MNRSLIPALEKILQQEIRIYEGYNALTELERKVIAPFDSQKVSDAASRREQFVEEMARLESQRLKVIKEIFGEARSKLTNLINDSLAGDERRRLLTLANKLKSCVNAARKDTRELGGIVRFGMGMVDGLISIFYSASRHVTKNYTRLGSIKESSTPAGGRSGGVLKKA